MRPPAPDGDAAVAPDRGEPPPSAAVAAAGPDEAGDGAAPVRRKRRQSALNELPSVGARDILDDKYQVIHALDEGGMGSVYAAQNVVLGIPVAIKVIRADLRGQEKDKLSARLLQEAQAAARVKHPAIVRVMDIGTAPNGDPYLVMELLTGDDLGAVLAERESVKPVKAVRLLLPIAHGLAAAHDKKVVHRDLKPENIILAETDAQQIQPKLIDFGLARTRIPRRRRLTQLGDRFGTPDYMSPEQVRGEDATAQADLWSFCVMLYELVAGQTPFDGDSYLVVLRRILQDEPLSLVELGLADEGLWRIIEKGLTKDLGRRWANMRDLGAALSGWLLAQGIGEDICGGSLEALWLQGHRSVARADVFASEPPPGARAPLEPPPAVDPAGPAQTAGSAQRHLPPPPPPSRPEPSDFSQRAQPSVPDPATPQVAPAEPSHQPQPAALAAAPAVHPGTAPSVKAAPSPSFATYQSRRQTPWLLYVLWVAAVLGVVGAVTGYLGIELPGVPAQLPSLVE